MKNVKDNKFHIGDRVKNTMTEDNHWVRAGDSGVIVEYDFEIVEDDDRQILVRWDDPIIKGFQGDNSWWVMESELELAK